jgi:predicted metal-dependent hydrolase
MDRSTARLLMESLNRDAERIAARFGLRYRAIEAERANVTSHYGICYSDGLIRIRLRHATTGRPLKYSSLVNTLCHELAHLRHFDHGLRFRAFYQRLLEYARSEGIYRPGRDRLRETPARTPTRARVQLGRGVASELDAEAESGPRQLSLFGS